MPNSIIPGIPSPLQVLCLVFGDWQTKQMNEQTIDLLSSQLLL